jgi:hypothetical protein
LKRRASLISRFLLAAVAVVLSAAAGHAIPVYGSGGEYVQDRTAPFYADGHWGYGQSWDANAFPDYVTFGLNTQDQTVLSPLVHIVGGLPPYFALNSGAGVYIGGPLVGFTGNLPGDTFSLDQISVRAQQLLRARDGATSINPIFQVTTAIGSSSWEYGPGGGLAPGPTVTASITSDLVNVTAVTSSANNGIMAQGQILHGTGIPEAATATAPRYKILTSAEIVGSPGTGTGGTGTYPAALVQAIPLQQTMTTAHGSFTANIGTGNPQGGYASNLMNVTVVPGGTTVTIGDTVTGSLVATASGTKIAAFVPGSGTNGGIGSYTLEIGTPLTIGSTAGIWSASLGIYALAHTIVPQMQTLVPNGKIEGIHYHSFSWYQAQSLNNDTAAGKLADLNAMFPAFDALDLPGTTPGSMFALIGFPPALSTDTALDISSYQTIPWARTNAPLAGGAYSGRAFLTGPAYPYQFGPDTTIHTGAFGTILWGEVGGYVRWLWMDKGIRWTPLWLSLTNSITTSGNTIVIPFDRPPGPDFASSIMTFQYAPTYGIKLWPNLGFNVKRNGFFLTLASETISGLNVILDLGTPPLPGDEVSYAYYGPGGNSPDNQSGVGGNLVMDGPDSVMAPGYKIGAWGIPFDYVLPGSGPVALGVSNGVALGVDTGIALGVQP